MAQEHRQEKNEGGMKEKPREPGQWQITLKVLVDFYHVPYLFLLFPLYFIPPPSSFILSSASFNTKKNILPERFMYPANSPASSPVPK